MVQRNSESATSVKKRSDYQRTFTGTSILGAATRRGKTHSQKRHAHISAGGGQSRKHITRQGRNNKATHLPHNNTSRHLPDTPCKSYCPSGAEAVDYMIRLSVGWYPNTPGRNFRRTHKPLEAAAAADSQADHHSPGTTAEAAEGSNLDQAAVPLITDILINDTGAITTSRKSHLEGDNAAAVVDRSNLCWT